MTLILLHRYLARITPRRDFVFSATYARAHQVSGRLRAAGYLVGEATRRHSKDMDAWGLSVSLSG
jgi:hypothetical protein